MFTEKLHAVEGLSAEGGNCPSTEVEFRGRNGFLVHLGRCDNAIIIGDADLKNKVRLAIG